LHIRKNNSPKKIRTIVITGIILSIILALIGVWGMGNNPISKQKWEVNTSYDWSKSSKVY
jgi:hypothetical protein